MSHDRDARLRELKREAQDLREVIRTIEIAKATGEKLSIQALYQYGLAIGRLPQVEREIAELEGRSAWE